jgi:hypothetical protein
MTRHEVGPRRSRSVDSFRRNTRLLAGAALLALAVGIASDATEGSVWAHHALLASLTASAIIVLLSVAVINEVVERRRRQRWSILAQFVMLELVRNARLVWTGVLVQVGLLTPEASRPDLVDTNRTTARDTPLVAAALRDVLADDALRHGLHEEIALLAAHTDEVLGRWAAVMLNADVYAEVMDRHVELAGDIGWLLELFDTSDPPEDHRRRRRAGSSPAVQIQGPIEREELARRIAVITQLAERLDRTTLELPGSARRRPRPRPGRSPGKKYATAWCAGACAAIRMGNRSRRSEGKVHTCLDSRLGPRTAPTSSCTTKITVMARRSC